MSSVGVIEKLCRLCALEIEYGFDIFSESEVKASLAILINKYLPIKVHENEFLPKQICESCHIGVAATVDLIDRMVHGQHYLCVMSKYLKEKKDEKCTSELKTDLPNTLINIQGDEKEIEMDDLAKGMDVERVYENHPMMSVVESGIKKRRGRPKKERDKIKEKETLSASAPVGGTGKVMPTSAPVGRPRRKINLPTRFRDAVAGDDLELAIDKTEEPSEFGDDGDQETEIEDSYASNSPSLPLEQTLTLEGNTVVVTQLEEEGVAQLPVAVNIELDFNESKQSLGEKSNEESGNQSNVPKASISSVMEKEQPSSLIKKTPYSQSTLKGKRRFYCEFCCSRFATPARYVKHMKKHKNVEIICDTCRTKFTRMVDLKSHQKNTNHTGYGVLENERRPNVSIRCPICVDRTFFTFERYRLHQATMHEGKKTHACTVCKKIFPYKYTLDKHLATHLPPEQKPCFRCEECNLSFNHMNSLKYHKSVTHNSGRRFVCSVCGSSHKAKLILQRHMLTHSNFRPYKCSLCGMCFKTFSNLHSHSIVHYKSKSFPCPVCDKSFTRRGVLKRHMDQHTGAKPYECSSCKKRFSQRNNLIEHTRIHTGAKPFKCVFCDQRFTWSSQERINIVSRGTTVPGRLQPNQGFWSLFNTNTPMDSGFGMFELRFHKNKVHGSTSTQTKDVDANLGDSTSKSASEIRSFQCKLCVEEFQGANELAAHQNFHKIQNNKAKRGGKCAVCSKWFADESSLVKHLADHEEEKAWFVAQPSLQGHPATHLDRPTDPIDLSGEPEPPSSPNQAVIYVIPKKEEASYQFLPLVTQGVFSQANENQLRYFGVGLERVSEDVPGMSTTEDQQIPYTRVVYNHGIQMDASAIRLSMESAPEAEGSIPIQFTTSNQPP